MAINPITPAQAYKALVNWTKKPEKYKLANQPKVLTEIQNTISAYENEKSTQNNYRIKLAYYSIKQVFTIN
jgi:hypothetical protein